MTQVLVFTTPAGGVMIMVPHLKDSPEDFKTYAKRKETQLLAEGFTNLHWMDREKLPEQDYDFRDAWVQGKDNCPVVDMTRAKEIHRRSFRETRVKLFKENDLRLQNALVSGDEKRKETAITYRDELRNAPANPAIEAATTPDELRAIKLIN